MRGRLANALPATRLTAVSCLRRARSKAAGPASMALVALLLLLLPGCDGVGRVEYADGTCALDGRPLSAPEVESEQAAVATRIASRQPWFAVITIGVVVVAVGSNAQRALALFRARHSHGPQQPLAERLREAFARQRNPVLFAALVAASLLLVSVGGGFYIYLDIDKRASERALTMLQFCHLAMRTQEEQRVLAEQRKNLDAIQSTAGDIRTLVGRLPPDEQRKAQLIVAQMNDALARQGKIVGDYAERADEAQRDLSSHTAAMEKGLASVQGDLAGMRSLPGEVKDLGTETQRIDRAVTTLDARFDDLRARETALDAKVDTLLARPVCSAQAARRAPAPPSSAEPGAPPAAVAPAPTPATASSSAPGGPR